MMRLLHAFHGLHVSAANIGGGLQAGSRRTSATIVPIVNGLIVRNYFSMLRTAQMRKWASAHKAGNSIRWIKRQLPSRTATPLLPEPL
jgi:hypothetical protein